MKLILSFSSWVKDPRAENREEKKSSSKSNEVELSRSKLVILCLRCLRDDSKDWISFGGKRKSRFGYLRAEFGNTLRNLVRGAPVDGTFGDLKWSSE